MTEIINGQALSGDQDPIPPLDCVQLDPYNFMTPRQQAFAELAARAMVDMLGVAVDDVRTLAETNAVNASTFTLIDGSPNGQYHGNYQKVLDRRSEDPRFMVLDLADGQVDALENTTYKTYWTMICEAQHRGIVLPDSVALSHINDLPWTATMLTGESLNEEGLVLVASVSGGGVSRVGFRPNKGGKSMRVRSTVIIPQPEHL